MIIIFRHFWREISGKMRGISKQKEVSSEQKVDIGYWKVDIGD